MTTLKDISDVMPLILIVDDIPENLKVIGSILINEKYNILPATNGKMAIELAVKEMPDLILLDVQMPDMDGFEVCKVLKKDSITKNIPIIFLTAKNETDNIVYGFEVGGDDYITKPFEAKEMIARVQTHLKLKFSISKLIDLIATKDKLFSIITHDLKGPFSAMLKISEDLYRNIIDYKKDQILETGKLLNESIKEAFDLLENLLQWSRSQTGRLEYLLTNQSLSEIVENSIKSISTIAHNKNIKIINKVPKNLHVYADINLLKTIIRNLLSNAVKFTKRGGNVKISASQKDNMVEISVEDTGVGIPVNIMENIFSIKQITSSPGTEYESGTGLGLILCREFVEKMGGTIWVKSELNVGSKFYFTLPTK